MSNLFSRRNAPASLVVVALAAIVIGCGGGGNGGGSGSTNSGSTNSGSTNGGTNPGTTSTTAGTLTGALPQDSVFYAVSTTIDPDNPSYDIRYVKPDGGTVSYQPGIAAAASPASPDPSQAGRFVFAAKPTGGTKYGIYRNTTASTSGSTLVAAPNYGEVRSVQVSRDGTKVIFVAAAEEGGASQVYSVNADGTDLKAIDGADTAFLSMDGTKIVYSKYLDAEGDSEIYVRFLADTVSTRLTTNNLQDSSPQLSKDGLRVVFTQSLPQPTDPNQFARERLAFINLAAGSSYTVTTIDPVPTADYQRAPSFNGGGDRVSFIVFSSATDESGLWTVKTDGTDPRQLVSSAFLEFATYWSTPQGRSLGGQPFGWSPARKK